MKLAAKYPATYRFPAGPVEHPIALIRLRNGRTYEADQVDRDGMWLEATARRRGPGTPKPTRRYLWPATEVSWVRWEDQ